MFMGQHAIWGRQEPGGPHVGPMNFAIWDCAKTPNQVWGYSNSILIFRVIMS